MNVGISIQGDATQAAVLRTYDEEQKSRLSFFMGRAVQELTADYLNQRNSERPNKLGGDRTNFYGQAAEKVALASALEHSPGEAVLTINHVGLIRAFRDVRIVPSGGKKALTIPIAVIAYGRRAGQFADLFVYRAKISGQGFLARKTGGGKKIELLYLLSRGVTQKQDRSLLPSDEEWTGAAHDAAENFITTQALALRQGGKFMIDLLLNLESETAKLVGPVTFKAGTSVAVRITLAVEPSAVPVFELAISPQSAPPEVKVYLDDFAAESTTVFLADWDTNDTRLQAFTQNKGSVSMDLAVRWTLAGKKREVPNLPVVVQQSMLNGPAASEGGPSFLTEAQSDARYPSLDNDGNLQVILIPRKGTEAALSAVVPYEGELLYLTDTKTVRVGDGTTPSGNTLNKGSICLTTPDSTTSGRFNATTVLWKIGSYAFSTKTLTLTNEAGGAVTFTTQFAVGDKILLMVLSGGTFGYLVTVASVNGAAGTVVITTDPIGIDLAAGSSFVAQASNSFSGQFASGKFNSASGDCSVATGFLTRATGSFALAEGIRSFASGDQTHAGGDTGRAFWKNSFAQGAGANSQYISVPITKASTSESPVDMGGSFTPYLTVATPGLFACEITISAAVADFSSVAMFKRMFLIKRSGTTVSLVGAVQTIGSDIGSNSGAPPSGWGIAISANDTSKKISIACTGASGTNITWSARLDVVHTV